MIRVLRYVGAVRLLGTVYVQLPAIVLIHADLAIVFPGAAHQAPHNGKKIPAPVTGAGDGID